MEPSQKSLIDGINAAILLALHLSAGLELKKLSRARGTLAAVLDNLADAHNQCDRLRKMLREEK